MGNIYIKYKYIILFGYNIYRVKKWLDIILIIINLLDNYKVNW